jgi:hypothetical protein
MSSSPSLYNSFQFQCFPEIDIDTIRAGLNSSVPDSNGPIEIPDDPYHYRNWPAEPALGVLRWYLDKYRRLEWIPTPSGDVSTVWNEEVSRFSLYVSEVFIYFKLQF